MLQFFICIILTNNEKKDALCFGKIAVKNEKIIFIKRSQMKNCERFSEIILGGSQF